MSKPTETPTQSRSETSRPETQSWSSWKPGDPVTQPEPQNMQSFDMAKLSVAEKYQFLIRAIAPRPIAWISTCNSQGQGNLSPFSFFNGTGTNPPALMVSIVPKANGTHKDTLKNILETREFVVNCVNEWSLPVMHHSSAGYGPNENEAEILGLKMMDSVSVKPQRVQGASWQFECKLYDTMTVGDGSVGSGTIVVGEILTTHVDSAALDEKGRLDFAKFSPVARIGGPSYALAGETVDMPRAEKR